MKYLLKPMFMQLYELVVYPTTFSFWKATSNIFHFYFSRWIFHWRSFCAQPAEENYAHPKICFFHVLFKVDYSLCLWLYWYFIILLLLLCVYKSWMFKHCFPFDRLLLWHFIFFQLSFLIVLSSFLWWLYFCPPLISGSSRM